MQILISLNLLSISQAHLLLTFPHISNLAFIIFHLGYKVVSQLPFLFLWLLFSKIFSGQQCNLTHLLNLFNLPIMQNGAQTLYLVLWCPPPLSPVYQRASIISCHFCYTICVQAPLNCRVITLREMLCIFGYAHAVSSPENVLPFMVSSFKLYFQPIV